MRPSDDPVWRLQQQAEARASRNGRDPVKAGRDAMALRKLLIEGGDKEPSIERILQVTAGAYVRHSLTRAG